MPESLLWINKHSASTMLSRSCEVESRKIRKHVQHERQMKTKGALGVPVKALNKKRPLSVKPKPRTTATRLGLRLDTNVNDRRREDGPQRSMLSASPSASPISHFIRSISSFPGVRPEELRSLAFYCQRTAPEWSGWRDASFWNKLILQACRSNQAILHGLVALGALHESSEVSEVGEASDLQHLALHQCIKATREACEHAISDIAALISCILFICLQNLQNSHSAYQLLTSGHSLVSDMDERLASGTLVLTDSEVTVLNKTLRPIIERLRMRFCSIVDIPSALALHVMTRQQTAEHGSPLPETLASFKTLLQARNKLEEIVDWAEQNVHPSLPRGDERSRVQALISSWIRTLDLTEIVTPERYHSLEKSKKLLKAAAIVVSILFDTLGTPHECSYDDHIDGFAEIIELYESAIGGFVQHPHNVSFGIDSGVVDTLAFVAGRCRDPNIRRSAVELLSRTDRTEGDLQGCTGSTVLQRLIDIEEEGLSVQTASDVPELHRVRIWEDHQYWDSGEIQIFFVKYPYDPAMGAQMRQESVRLKPDSLRVPKEKAIPREKATSEGLNRLPYVKYGRGFGSFLDSRSTYHEIWLSSFHIPIPRL
ncbi:hypothetical protein ABEF95_003156 [Exophiala dermatitidis]